MPKIAHQLCSSHEEKTLKGRRKEKAQKKVEGREIEGKRLQYRYVVGSYPLPPSPPSVPIQRAKACWLTP